MIGLRLVAPLALLLIAAGCATTADDAQVTPPNIVLVITDDQGWGDMGVHGNAVLDTPRLDGLAMESGRIERFYVSPVCTPTRAALMTGRNSIRTRAIDTFRGRAMMDTQEVTIAEVLASNGYATGLFGKWHLGDSYPMRPQDQGFEEVLCHRGGGLAQPADHLDNNRRYTNAWLYHNGQAVQTEGYCMDVYTDYALDFMREAVADGRPFFTYLATNTPHGPWHDVPEDLLAKYKARDLSEVLPDPKQADRMAASFAMIENIDQNVGRLLDELDALAVADNTIFIYMHDNGPAIRHYVGEMRGMKSEVFEGGIRSPFFVRWPDVVPAGLARPEIASHVDVWPTLVEATGVRAPAVAEQDGHSLWPLLTNTAREWPERLVHIQAHRGDRRVAEHNFAVIGQRYKLLRASGFGREQLPEEPAPLALYDLQEDPLEQRNLAEAMPERVAAMLDAHNRWFAGAIDHPGYGTPPPIVLDFEAEPYHELNRNDWRPNGGGYGPKGGYRLELAKDARVDIFLYTRGKSKAEGSQVTVRWKGDVIIDKAPFENVEGERISIPLRDVALSAGTAMLEFELLDGDQVVPAEHIQIAPAGAFVSID